MIHKDLFKMHKRLILFILMPTFFFSTTLGSFLTSEVFMTSSQILHVPTPQYPTIQSAIDAANPGNTIEVASKVYNEHIMIDKSVSLIGENPSNTIIDGSGTGSDAILVFPNVNNVRIEGFTIQKGEDFGLESANLRMTNSRGHMIRGNIIRQSSNGLRLAGVNDSYIINNVITENTVRGIYLSSSSRNNILANLIEKNAIGVLIAASSSKDNTVIHNNFVDNVNQAAVEGAPANFWHNGAEGNYWSDYNGTDTDGDGIGDTGGCPGSCTPVHSVDWYPLVEEWSETRYFPSYQTSVRCNSTVASFNFNYSLAQIGFNVTGPSGAVSFCNVTIDKSVLDGSFTVFVDQVSRNYLSAMNSTHTSINFTFTHSSTRKIRIQGTKVYGNFIPIADFTYNPIQPKENEEIRFNDTSTDPDGTVDNWLWNFDDGNATSSKNAVHTYTKGKYNVTLTVTDNNGAIGSIMKKVVVGNLAPTANFTYFPADPKENQDIQFTDSSIDPDGTVANWLWDFGDGNTSSQQNPTHKYTNRGTYNITLTVTDNDGATNAVTKTIVVAASSQSDYTLYFILIGGVAGALILGIALFLLKKKKKLLASTKLVTR